MDDFFTARFNGVLKEYNVNQTLLAKAINVSKQCITDYKKGLSYPSIKTLQLLCKELNVPSDYLLGLSDTY